MAIQEKDVSCNSGRNFQEREVTNQMEPEELDSMQEEPEPEKAAALSRLREAMEHFDGAAEDILWETLVLFQNEPYYTAKGLDFTYFIKGNEMFVTRKDKSITRATVVISFRKAMELGGCVKGPKKLGTFGASYLYPVFQRIGVIKEV